MCCIIYHSLGPIKDNGVVDNIVIEELDVSLKSPSHRWQLIEESGHIIERILIPDQVWPRCVMK